MPLSPDAHALILRLAADPQLLQNVTNAGTEAEKKEILAAAGLAVPNGTGEVLNDEEIRSTIQEIVGVAADENQSSKQYSAAQIDHRAKDLIRILMAIGVYEMIPPPL